MTKRWMTIGSVVLALGLGACGKSEDDFIGKMKGFRDKMCACKDAACAEKLDAEQDAWEDGLKKGKRPSDEKLAEYEKIKNEYRACRASAAGE